MKKIASVFLCLLVALLAVGLVPSARAQTYAGDRVYVAQWLFDRQFSNPSKPYSYGAIRVNADPFEYNNNNLGNYHVVPYRANIAVLGYLHSQEPYAPTVAQRWMKWYFNHLTSTSAPYGAPNDHTYDVNGDNQIVEPKIDATDSAIATFFSVLWEAHKNGVSSSDFDQTKIAQLVATLVALRQSDGLYWAGEDYNDKGVKKHVKYLEDQSEVFAGWRDMALLYSAFGNSAEATKCQQRAAETQTAIVKEFYNRFNDGLYAWVKYEDGTFTRSNLNIWYAPGDASTQAQMWPQLWGVVPPTDIKTQTVVNAVNSYWASNSPYYWPTQLGTDAIDGRLINASFARAMSLAGEKDKVTIYLDKIKDRRYPDTTLSPAKIKDPSTFNVDDAGWLLYLLTDYANPTSPTPTPTATPIPTSTPTPTPPPATSVWSASDLSVGSDSVSRLLWTSTNNTFQIWNVNDSGVKTQSSPVFGPVRTDGLLWLPVKVSAGADGLTRVLMVRSDGYTTVWVLNADLSFRSSFPGYGPYAPYRCIDMVVAPDGSLRLLWTGQDRTFGLWSVSPQGVPSYGPGYGPISTSDGQWSARHIALGADGNVRLLLSSSGNVNAVWTMNSALSFASSTQHGYGDANWSSVSLALNPFSGGDNKRYLLWKRNADKVAVFWRLAPNDSLTIPQALEINGTFGPYNGWTPVALSVGGDNIMRALWNNTNGSVAFWKLSPDGNSYNVNIFGPLP